MKSAGFDSLRWACFMACAAMIAAAPAFASIDAADTEDNPYTVISQRNIFRLGTPPPPPSPDADKPADLPKVMLTGFFESAHVMRVLLAKPPLKDATNSITYLSLKAGEGKDGVEVVRIRYEKGEVDIINSGTAMTLSAASNTFAASGLALKGAGEAHKNGMAGSRGIRGIASSLGGTSPSPLMPSAPEGSPSIATAAGSAGSSAIIMGGGAGYGAGATPGTGSSSTSPRYPGAAPTNPGAETGAPGNGSSGQGAFVSGSSGSPVAPTSPATAPNTSMSEAQMLKYLADHGQANQNQGTPPPTPPDQ
jgi:hypothetical protein